MCYICFTYFPILKIPNFLIKWNTGNLSIYFKLLAFPSKIMVFYVTASPQPLPHILSLNEWSNGTWKLMTDLILCLWERKGKKVGGKAGSATHIQRNPRGHVTAWLTRLGTPPDCPVWGQVSQSHSALHPARCPGPALPPLTRCFCPSCPSPSLYVGFNLPRFTPVSDWAFFQAEAAQLRLDVPVSLLSRVSQGLQGQH